MTKPERTKLQRKVKEVKELSLLTNKLIEWGWTDDYYNYVRKYKDGTETVCDTSNWLTDNEGNRIYLRKNYLVLKGKDSCSCTVEALYDNVELETFVDSEGTKVDKCLVIRGIQSGEETIIAKVYNPNVMKEESSVVFLYEVSHTVRTTQYIYATSKQDAIEKYKENIGTNKEQETTSTEYDEAHQIIEYHNNILLND